jgi:hypothetical protein
MNPSAKKRKIKLMMDEPAKANPNKSKAEHLKPTAKTAPAPKKAVASVSPAARTDTKRPTNAVRPSVDTKTASASPKTAPAAAKSVSPDARYPEQRKVAPLAAKVAASAPPAADKNAAFRSAARSGQLDNYDYGKRKLKSAGMSRR